MAKRSARDQTVQPNPVQPPAPLLSPPGQRDTVASEQAASEGAHAGQDLPPTAVEVLAYQLGIRLEQAREEDGHSDPDSMYQTDRDFIPTDIGLAVYSFRALDQAFSDFADVVPSNPTITGSGTRLINDCVQAWNKWSSLPFEGFKLEDAEPLNTHFVYFNLQQLVDVIDRMFDYLPTMVAVPWFVLGRSIGECPTCPKCSGRYDTLEEDWPIHGSGNGNEFPEEEQIPKCSGHDDDLLEVVQMLIEHLGLSAPDLFPLISESRETRKLLPYHPDIACFRKGMAREYLETEPLPPPATCYGFLLSLVGETRRLRHVGCRVAPSLLNRPEQSVVLRTVWRVKKTPLGSAGNTRPDYQQLLSPVELIIWVDSSDEVGDKPSLEERVQAGLSNPRDISRFGGLSLGESTHLVNDVCVLSDGLGRLAAETGRAFLKHPNGRLTLPIWVDHVGSAGTRFVTGDLESLSLNVSPPRERMPCIHPEGDPDDRNPESASRP